MREAFFAIRDASRRKAKPCAFMCFSEERGFEIEIVLDASVDDVPAFFAPFIERRERKIPAELSLRWVRERIPPSGRQNLGEIMSAHSLNEYSELALLRSCRGESSQDDFIVEEIDEESFASGVVDRTTGRRRELGESIKSRRINLGISQKALADAVGIDQPALSRIEAGKTNVTFDLLADIDEALSRDHGSSIIGCPRQVLWTQRRLELYGLIERFDGRLGQIYDRLVNELERYADGSTSAIADSRVISHCFREFMNTFPELIDDAHFQNMRGEEQETEKKVYRLLGGCTMQADHGDAVVGISRDLYDALIDLKEIHDAGSSNEAARIRAAVSDAKEDAAVPIAAWKDAKDKAQKTTHLARHGEELIPSLDDYLMALAVLENTLEVRLGNIYDAKARLFSLIDRANRVDARGEYTPPEKSEVILFISLLGNVNLRERAFRELKNPYWLEALEEERFFKAYEGLDESSQVLFAVASFLEYCAPYCEARVIKILRRLSKKGWTPARSLLLQIASKLPIENIPGLITEITSWAKEGYGVGTYFWSRSQIQDLVEKALRSEEEEIRKLGVNLFSTVVRPRRSERKNSPYRGIDSCIPSYAYERIVERIMPSFSPKERLMIEKNMINLYMKEVQPNKNYTVSSRMIVWSLEEKELMEASSRRSCLIPWINEYQKSILELLMIDPKAVLRLPSSKSSPIILRVILQSVHEYFVSRKGEDIDPTIYAFLKRVCTNDDVIFDKEYEVEVMPILTVFARTAKEEDKREFLSKLMVRLDDWERRQRDKCTSADAEFVSGERRRLEHALLSVFGAADLPKNLQKTRSALEAELGPYAGPRMLYKVEAMWGSKSPKTAENFKSMGAKETLVWLYEWEPTSQESFYLVDREGVANELKKLLKEDSSFFARYSSYLGDLDGVYIARIFDAWKESAKEGNAVPIESILNVCLRVIAKAEPSEECREGRRSRSCDMHLEVKQCMARMLTEMLESAECVLSIESLSSILTLLLDLRTQDLTQFCTNEEWLNEEDAVTASLNVLSSIALKGIIFWIARKETKDAEDEMRALDALEGALPSEEVSKADVAAFSLQFARLFACCQSWLEDRYERIFGSRSAMENQKLALALQLSAQNVNVFLFSFLKPALKNALEIGPEQYPSSFSIHGLNTFSEHFGYWLYSLYATGQIELNDDMLDQWHALSESSSIGKVLARICDVVRRAPDTSTEIAYRVQTLWEFVAEQFLGEAEALQGAFDLVESGFYPFEWLRKAVLREAQSHSIAKELDFHFAETVKLATGDPKWGITLLRTVIESDTEEATFYYEQNAEKLIALYLETGGAKDDADLRFCMDRLGRKGMLDLDA